MTEAEALALPARELDALVAEKVMGWRRLKPDRVVPPRKSYKRFAATHMLTPDDAVIAKIPRPFPKYSTTWDGMGLVVERMREEGYHYTIESTRHYVRVFLGRVGVGDEDIWVESAAEADTAPRAVCIAALKAKGVIE